MVKGKAFRNSAIEARKGTHKRSSHKNTSLRKKVTYDEKQQKKKTREEVNKMQAEMAQAQKDQNKEKYRLLEKKKKRKEENEIKAGQYQVIKNTSNIRNWQKKAKKNLLKMSAEKIELILARSAGGANNRMSQKASLS